MSTAAIVGVMVLLVVLFALSAFFSGAETAFFSLKPPLLRRWKHHGNKRQQLAARLMEEHHDTLITILFGTNLVNILIAVVVNRLGEKMGLGTSGPLIAGLVATVLLLIFGEVTPKTIAFGRADAISERIATTIAAIRWLLHPAVVVLRVASRAFLSILGAAPRQRPLSADEFQTFISLGEHMSAFTPREAGLLREVFNLREKTAAAAMIPRIDVRAVDVSWDAARLVSAIRRYRHRRLAVMDGDLDNLIGSLDVRRFFRLAPEAQADWRNTCVDEPVFVPEHTTMDKTLSTLRATGGSLVFIVDEYGGIAGIVSLEDVLEEVIGELNDEYDEPLWKSSPLSGGRIRLSGMVPLHDLPDLLPFEVPDDTMADTVSGLIAEELGSIPEPGNTVRVGDVVFEVRRVARRRCIEVDVKHDPLPEKIAEPSAGSATEAQP